MDRQDVINEVLDSQYSNLFLKWESEFDTDSIWNQKNIEYNNAGIPVLKMYIHESRKLYTDLYVNNLKSNITYKSNNTITNIDDIVEYDSSTNVIKAIGTGTAKINSKLAGIFEGTDENDSIYNSDIIIVIEDEPILKRIEWDCDNPLYISSDYNLKIKTIYDNGDEFLVNNLDLISSNNYWFDIINSKIKINNKNGIAFLDFTNKLENVEYAKPLKVIIADDIKNTSLNDNTIISYEYIDGLIAIAINSTTTWFFNEVYTNDDGSIISHNLTSHCDILNSDIVTISKNGLITPKTNSINKSDEITVNHNINTKYYNDLQDAINFTISISDVIDSVFWNIEDKEINILDTEKIINVIINYASGISEDVADKCEYKYDENIISIEGNKIIPKNPGITTVKLLSSFVTNNINSDTIYTIEIVKNIEKVDILDEKENVINNITLDLYINDEKDLSYIIHPDDASVKELEWSSSDSSVVTVNENGYIKVLSEGIAHIYASKPQEYIEENEVIIEEINEETVAEYENTYGTVTINALSIDVNSIKFNTNSTTLYVGADYADIQYTIKPNNASNKNVSFVFESDTKQKFFNYNTDDLTMNVIREGTGVLKIISADNPEIYDEMEIIGVDNRVQSITINNGNDSDYEWYDNYTKSPESFDWFYKKKNGDDLPSCRGALENERWDDNDFPRYYCAINNSLQLNTTITPSGAQFADLNWYSSDAELINVSDNGIVTALAYVQPLDMVDEDDINYNINDSSETYRRFPNTTWVTAINKKTMKSGVCQVRAFNNYITGINISYPNEHDIDIDSIEDNGSYNSQSDHEQDYIINVGETIEIPVTLTVQDPNFGPSNNIEWYEKINSETYMKFNDESAEDDDIISVENETIKHYRHEIFDKEFDWTSINPDELNTNKKSIDLKITGKYVGDITLMAKADSSYYVHNESVTQLTDYAGGATVGDYRVTVYYDSEKLKQTIENASITLTPHNEIIISVPEIFDKYSNPLYIDKQYSEKCKKIIVEIEDEESGGPISDIKCLIEAYRTPTYRKQIIDRTNISGRVTIPSALEDEYEKTGLVINSYNVLPGTGTLVNKPKSRDLKIRVVASPSKIYLTFLENTRSIKTNINNFPSYNLRFVWTQNNTLVLRNKDVPVPLFINFDEEFEEMLRESSWLDNKTFDNVPLNDKYLSFAWFTSDPRVFTIGERTQDNPPIPIDYFESNKLNTINYRGYGRYMTITPRDVGEATLTIVNIMSGKAWERKIKVVDN